MWKKGVIMKTVDLSKTVYELTSEFPELVDILKDLGFRDITNPVVRNTAGRVMTLPKGCVMKGIELEKVVKTLEEHGYTVKGG